MIEPISTGMVETGIFDVLFTNTRTNAAYSAFMKQMGSPRAFFAEFLLAEAWSEKYVRENQSNGFDLLPKQATERPVEVKMASKSGVDLRPSSGKGAGRTPKTDQFFANCERGDYLVADGIHFAETGNIRYAIFSGKDLKNNGIFKFSKKEIATLFGG